MTDRRRDDGDGGSATSIPASAGTPVKARGRPRSEAARRAVLRAAYDVLAEHGTAGFSIEAVATRANVARTTVYRTWTSKGLLAVDSLLDAFRQGLNYVETDDPVADFKRLIASLVRLLSGPTGTIAASVLVEAQRDEETRRAFLDAFSRPLRQQSGRVLARGMKDGLLRADLDISTVLDAVVGAAYLRLLIGQPLDDAWSAALADTVLRGCLQDGPYGTAGQNGADNGTGTPRDAEPSARPSVTSTDTLLEGPRKT